MIQFAVKDYRKTYIQENPNAAVIELKEKIYEAILPLIIDFRSKKYYNDFENIREIYGKHFLKRKEKKITAINFLNQIRLWPTGWMNWKTKSPGKLKCWFQK